jgi:hypothetical protein
MYGITQLLYQAVAVHFNELEFSVKKSALRRSFFVIGGQQDLIKK